MITRAIDNDNQWIFGNGRECYLNDENAVGQNIKTRVQSFYQDCFFDLNAGIDWFNFLGTKNQEGLKNAIAKTILSTTGVYSLDELSLNLSENRELLIQYLTTTIWGQKAGDTITLG